MVLYEYAINRWVKPVIERHKEEGRKEGRKIAHQEWRDWLQRKDAAESLGQPFDEPRPSKTR